MSLSRSTPRTSLEDLKRVLAERPGFLRLVSRLWSAGAVKPVLTVEGVTYPELEDVEDWPRIMELLVDAGLVERFVADRVVSCPRCGSMKITVRLHCTRCGSFNVERTRIIQHLVCGYTDTEVKFKGGVCPKCGLKLGAEGSDYVVLGEVFECLNCGWRMSRPEDRYRCMECGEEFDYRTASYRPVYGFRLAETARKQARRLLISFIKTIAESRGLRVDEKVEVPGISGISHTFDAVIYDGDEAKLFVDVVSNEADLLNSMVKQTDVEPGKYLILTSSKDENLEKLARGRNIRSLSPGDLEELATIIKGLKES